MQNISTIKIVDKEYPEALKEISNPPQMLYFLGKFLTKEDLCFAVVGTRKCSPYGKQATLDISGKLAQAGVTIVSGMAEGIDAFSHQACVDRNKRTVAVLGTGLDEKSIYPQSNLSLAKKIIETGGCLVSELPPGTHGSKFTFPDRNRIISGLSRGVLVVEAKAKSGSLITADYAFLQGKKVFAIPGPIYSSNSTGCNRLIKRGAKLVDNVDDILQELDLPVSETQQTNGNYKGTLDETLIIDVLKEESMHIDKITEKTKLPAMTVASCLAVLEIEGVVQNLGGNIYAFSR